MADWKQITARIRRARTSKEPAAQLANLFEKTSDAMVAFELARYFESANNPPDAIKWYSTAAQRFRRADWKTKAHQAIVRLGGEVPAAAGGQSSVEGAAENLSPAVVAPEPTLPFERTPEAYESMVAVSSAAESAAESSQPASGGQPAASPGAGRRSRGRRGGRNRRKGAAPQAHTAAAPGATSILLPGEIRGRGNPPSAHESEEPKPPRVVHERAIPRVPVEPVTEAAGPAARGRFGDPGLASRLSQLEMHLRRLLTCEPVRLDDVASAPAGPGVFVLTDSDLTSYYYVEACQTLRIAIPNLVRGGSSRRGADSIKPQLADHLGIPESRVSKYLSDHCVVRWLQLDEGASHFAHFAIAILRPVLNDQP